MSFDSNLSLKYALLIVISHKLGILVLLSVSNFILYIHHIIERLSIEYCKTKANYLPITDQLGHSVNLKPK